MEREEAMREALRLAEEAGRQGEVPVGCVILRGGEVIGRGRNRREELGDATAHAEIEAIRDAGERNGSWHLDGAELYVTLEPCIMCAGAIMNARIGTVVYGAKDERAGACGSVLNIYEENFGFHPKIYGGVLEEPCRALLNEFFRNLR